MPGGSAGQFAVGPMIHGLVSWRQFWIFSGIALVVIAAVARIATASGHDARPIGGGSLLSITWIDAAMCPPPFKQCLRVGEVRQPC